jgi:hypothetical protein
MKRKFKLTNKKDDKITSYFTVNLTEEELEIIKDVFLDLKVKSLTEEGEAGYSTERYITILNNFTNITGRSAS